MLVDNGGGDRDTLASTIGIMPQCHMPGQAALARLSLSLSLPLSEG